MLSNKLMEMLTRIQRELRSSTGYVPAFASVNMFATGCEDCNSNCDDLCENACEGVCEYSCDTSCAESCEAEGEGQWCEGYR